MNVVRRALIAVCLWMMAEMASACPVCYGAADSPMTKGMNTAIVVMLGIIGSVLLVIVLCFFVLWRRARKGHQVSGELCIDGCGILLEKKEEGVIQWNNF